MQREKIWPKYLAYLQVHVPIKKRQNIILWKFVDMLKSLEIFTKQNYSEKRFDT